MWVLAGYVGTEALGLMAQHDKLLSRAASGAGEVLSGCGRSDAFG